MTTRELNATLREELLRMDEHDQTVRAALAADGSLYAGYHPRMAAVHDANADRLAEIVRELGWPTEELVGEDGAHAAWRIAQHSINRPALMREFRALIDLASSKGQVPRWQFAYIDDRIHAFEGRPQRYGTQWRDRPGGPEPYPLDDPMRVDQRRAALQLPSMEELRVQSANERYMDAEAAQSMDEAELTWRRIVGWVR